MLSLLKTITIIVLVGFAILLVVTLPEWSKEEPVHREPPCEELVWMRDYPQARCVEFWNNYKVEEV